MKMDGIQLLDSKLRSYYDVTGRLRSTPKSERLYVSGWQVPNRLI